MAIVPLRSRAWPAIEKTCVSAPEIIRLNPNVGWRVLYGGSWLVISRCKHLICRTAPNCLLQCRRMGIGGGGSNSGRLFPVWSIAVASAAREREQMQRSHSAQNHHINKKQCCSTLQWRGIRVEEIELRMKFVRFDLSKHSTHKLTDRISQAINNLAYNDLIAWRRTTGILNSRNSCKF